MGNQNFTHRGQANNDTALALNEPLLEGNTDQSLTCSSRKALSKTDIHSNGRQGQLHSSRSDEAKGPLEVRNSYFENLNEMAPSSEDANIENREKRSEYVFEDRAVYEGEWLGREKDGVGVQTWPDKAKYEGKKGTGRIRVKEKGEWKKNRANGKGKFFHTNGDIYEGEWEAGKASGYGVYLYENGRRYEGQWKNDVQEGFGIETLPNGSSYEGDYKEGKKHGKGFYLFYDGSKYNGDWLENKMSGSGVYTWVDGRKYEGQWLNNHMHGKGRYEWQDGRKYEGEYFENQKHGYGAYTWSNGVKYEGFWAEGQQNGKGKFYLVDGVVKVGIWENGKIVKWIGK